jgi:hypothetical protein
MTERRKLTDILRGAGGQEQLSRLWGETTAAAEFRLLPPGEYTFRVLAGELTNARRGTPGYRLTLEVAGGEHEGRRVWHDFWFTPAALPMTKRDLAKIGVTDLRQLEQPVPAGILVRGRVVIHRDDGGNERNRLRGFEAAGTEPGDPFEPKPDAGDGDGPGSPPAENAPPPPEGDKADPPPNGEPHPGVNGAPARRKRSRRRAGAPGTEGGAEA